jgi:hypothetical protein
MAQLLGKIQNSIKDHLAVLIAIQFSYHSANSYVDTNIKGTLNILQAACDTD